MEQIIDIKGNIVEPRDKILISQKGHIMESFVLYFTNKSMVISRGKSKYTQSTNKYPLGYLDYSSYVNAEFQKHKYYLNVDKIQPNSIYILEKQASIPENLRKFIKY